MVLTTVDVMGRLHGNGIARRIEQMSGDLLSVQQGTLCPVLVRLEREGLSHQIALRWKTIVEPDSIGVRAPDTDYSAEKRGWEQTPAIIARFFDVTGEDLT